MNTKSQTQSVISARPVPSVNFRLVAVWLPPIPVVQDNTSSGQRGRWHRGMIPGMALDICLSDILEPEALPIRKYNRAGCTVVAGVCATLHILVTIKKLRGFLIVTPENK